jgi:hypothetical protein
MFLISPIRLTILIAAMSVLNLAALKIGERQPPHPALAGFDLSCVEKLCWYGIVPGETRADAALRLLREHGWEVERQDLLDFVRLEATRGDGCAMLMGGGIGLDRNPRLDTVPITGCAGLRLGDLMLRFGAPERVSTCDRRRVPVPQFISQLNVVLVYPKISGTWLSPFDQVDRILLIPPTPFPLALRWRGFAPAWRYQQLGQGTTCG